MVQAGSEHGPLGIVTEMDPEFRVAEVARLWTVWSEESQTLASSATTGKRL